MENNQLPITTRSHPIPLIESLRKVTLLLPLLMVLRPEVSYLVKMASPSWKKRRRSQRK